MATTGELRAIIEELQLIDIGDAVSYLGEETQATEALIPNRVQEGLPNSQTDLFATYNLVRNHLLVDATLAGEKSGSGMVSPLHVNNGPLAGA